MCILAVHWISPHVSLRNLITNNGTRDVQQEGDPRDHPSLWDHTPADSLCPSLVRGREEGYEKQSPWIHQGEIVPDQPGCLL